MAQHISFVQANAEKTFLVLIELAENSNGQKPAENSKRQQLQKKKQKKKANR